MHVLTTAPHPRRRRAPAVAAQDKLKRTESALAQQASEAQRAQAAAEKAAAVAELEAAEAAREAEEAQLIAQVRLLAAD